jgi:hypothetical protein
LIVHNSLLRALNFIRRGLINNENLSGRKIIPRGNLLKIRLEIEYGKGIPFRYGNCK